MSDDRDTTDAGIGAESASDDATPASAAPVSRRAALKVIGTVPIAGALAGGVAWGQQGVPQSGAQQPHRHLAQRAAVELVEIEDVRPHVPIVAETAPLRPWQ